MKMKIFHFLSQNDVTVCIYVWKRDRESNIKIQIVRETEVQIVAREGEEGGNDGLSSSDTVGYMLVVVVA
jgi:hypothetical protein